MSNKNRNNNYDILDRILQESDRKDALGRTWIADPNHRDGGYWSDSAESFGQRAGQGVSDIEKYLRS